MPLYPNEDPPRESGYFNYAITALNVRRSSAQTIATEAFAMLGRPLPDVEVPVLTHKFKGPF